MRGVRPAREGHPDGEALAAWLLQTLPRYKVPDAFYQWPETDPNTFKIDRGRFRRLALEGPTAPLVSTDFSSGTSQPTE